MARGLKTRGPSIPFSHHHSSERMCQSMEYSMFLVMFLLSNEHGLNVLSLLENDWSQMHKCCDI